MIALRTVGILCSAHLIDAFVVPIKVQYHARPLYASKLPMKSNDRIDVVLFGIGDLRTDDHGGLMAAMKAQDSKIFPLAMLDSVNLANIPGAISSTLDTAELLSSALLNLQSQLQSLNLNLKVEIGDMAVTFKEITSMSDDVHVHVCDLDAVDNELGYGSFSRIQSIGELPANVKLHTWSCHLRDEPWVNIASMSDSHPIYAQQYSGPPSKPHPSSVPVNKARSFLSEVSEVPSADSIAAVLKTTLGLDDDRCEQEKISGLYATHWGGLSPQSVGESKVLAVLQVFAKDCGEDDETWAAHPEFIGRSCKRNARSLEHAAVSWMMKGDGKKATPNSNNLIAGESMTRYLTAPLMLGTVSPRRLWHAAKDDVMLFPSVLRTISETREWHKILAARNICTDLSYQGQGGMQYSYFRWQGFLCRYAKAPSTKAGKDGILLVHGFGASGSQWTKAFQEMEGKIDAGLAPDLIGFGHSEKPPLTYTQYLWQMYALTFIKEIAIGKEKWDTFAIGGNSIGGYTGMSTAADDSVRVDDTTSVSSAGAPGSGRCTGLILMNSAGQIQKQEEVEAMRSSGAKMLFKSMAEITHTDALPNCKPIARPFARVFGNGLLYYLRPRIQSICKNLYPTNPAAVDSVLCEGILRDSLDPGAVNVMISGSKLPPPRTANELLGADFGSALSERGSDSVKEGMWTGPVLVAQGMLDPLNDATSRANMFRALRKGITISPINAGHCPHDELPSDVASAIVSWKDAMKMASSSQQVVVIGD
jgi:pimeloyl-ACP methyl ester carboxylesterase